MNRVEPATGAMRGLRRTWVAAWQEAWANRRGFWLQIAITVVNDLVWVIFWVIFFREVGAIQGWDIDLVMVLFATLTTASGIVLGLLNNVRHIGPLASSGGLDALLALPVAPLPQLLSRRIEAVNVGDLVFGVVLFGAFGDPTPRRTLIFVFGVACAVLVMAGFLIFMGSLSFITSRSEAGDLGFHAILLFSSYPIDIFGGATRLFLYAIVPAGFVTSVPARLVDDFSVGWAGALAAVALGVAGLGASAFTLGLRRYTSGAVWTQA